MSFVGWLLGGGGGRLFSDISFYNNFKDNEYLDIDLLVDLKILIPNQQYLEGLDKIYIHIRY